MYRPNPTTVNTDVLVIGGGIGGARAALRAKELGADVTLVEKAFVSRAGPMTYVHSQFAPNKLLEGDELLAWIEEFVVGANYLADQDWVEGFIRDAYFRVQELVDMGVPFGRDAEGKLKYISVRGHKIGTSLGVDGKVAMEILRKRMKQTKVRLLEKIMMSDLLTSDGRFPTRERVSGAIGIHVQTGEPFIFKAKTVIINTGPMFPRMHYAFSDHCSGDGHAMAFRVGAEMSGMEFAQFAAWSYFNRKFFTPGQAKIQGIGARFINSAEQEFMQRYDPTWGNKSGLFQVARAIATENLEGRGPCYVDMRHCTDEDIAALYKVAPTVGVAFREFNIDPKRDLLEVNPFVVIGSGSTSGIRIDQQGRTNIEGLFAVGFCTHMPHMMTGISGGGISTFSNVGGYRAGETAANMTRQMEHPTVHEQQVRELINEFFAHGDRRGQVRPSDLWIAIGEITARASFALFKNAERICKVRDELRVLQQTLLRRVSAPDLHELIKANEVRNYLQMAEVVCEAMVARQESRGELVRVDYPHVDNDEWLKWVIVKRSDDGNGLGISFWDLPYDRYPIKAPPGKTPMTYPIPDQYKHEGALV